MDYEKKFIDFLDKMQGLLDNAKKQGLIIVRVEDLENALSEFVESEDERVRRWLEETIECMPENSRDFRDVRRIDVLHWLEKQGEHKPIDKVEPKFKMGDWCIDDEDDTIFQIVKVLDNTYIYKTTEGDEYSCTHYSLENDARLWTIEDAKAGDVLVCKGTVKYSNGIKYERICLFNNIDNAFFTLTKTSNHVENYDIDVNIDYPDNTVPATKEQREILFMVMTDAEYTFDFEKKELRKIEQKIKWNKEDEEILMHIIQDVELLLGDEDERFKDERRQSLIWLKSLKQRMEQ